MRIKVNNVAWRFVIEFVVMTYGLFSLFFSTYINQMDQYSVETGVWFLLSGNEDIVTWFTVLKFHFLLPFFYALLLLFMNRKIGLPIAEVRSYIGLSGLLLSVQALLVSKYMPVALWFEAQYSYIGYHAVSATVIAILWLSLMIFYRKEKALSSPLSFWIKVPVFLGSLMLSVVTSALLMLYISDLGYVGNRAAHTAPYCLNRDSFRIELCENGWEKIARSGNIEALIDYYEVYPQRDPVALTLELIDIYQYTRTHFTDDLQWADKIGKPNTYTVNKQLFEMYAAENEQIIEDLSVAIKDQMLPDFIAQLKQKTVERNPTRFELIILASLAGY